MSNSTTESDRELINAQPKLSRKALAIQAVCAGWITSLIVSTIKTFIWDQIERSRGSHILYDWSPLDDLTSILMLMPIRFIVYSVVHPAGWLFWLGFGATLWNQSRVFILVSIGGSIWFGVLWPEYFNAIMGI